jgi:glycyl-tRNA synthetase
MEEMRQILREFDMKSPTTGNPVSDPMEFNLMFQTEIGPTGTYKG